MPKHFNSFIYMLVPSQISYITCDERNCCYLVSYT